MNIEGRCHCGNISYTLSWPGEEAAIPVRVCGCDFCTKHGGAWTSNRAAKLRAVVRDETALSRYEFGTHTAWFYVCARCGVPPFVISEIDARLHAVVNVNTFEGVDSSLFERSPSDFEGEDTPDRIERRKRNWIPDVRIGAAEGGCDSANRGGDK